MLISILRLVGVVLNTLVFASATLVASLFERDGKTGWPFAMIYFRTNLWLSGATVTSRGAELLDRSKQYVFMSNHTSLADIVACAVVLPDFQLRWVAKHELTRIPVFGWALLAMKNIVIDRSNHAQAVESFRLAKERIRRGISVVVFPEATRGDGKTLLPFKKGGFVFALETETPIVPIAILGSEKVIPREGWQMTPGVVEVIVGEPVDVRRFDLENKEALMAEVRRRIESMLVTREPYVEPAEQASHS